MELHLESNDCNITHSVLDGHENNSLIIDNSKGPELSDLEEDLACSVCLMLAVQPTTLVCGHTSCRACLAKWYFTSKTKVCPMCRQAYHDLPKINIQIRNMTHKLYPIKAKAREEELEADKEAKKLVAKFDKKLKKQGNSSGRTDIASFCAGILMALCSFIVLYLAWYWQSSDAHLLIHKPVETWKPKDVAQWFGELKWAKVYSDAVLEKNVDGTMLLSISQTHLDSVFNMTDPLHQSAFLFAVDLLRANGVKLPGNLWEYKATFPGRSLFLAFGMKDFPRTCLLYLYVYFYDDMFLPFMQATTGSDDLTPRQIPKQGEEITYSQWIRFLVYFLLVPNWLIIVFSSQMFSHHFFTPWFVISTGVLYQVLEYITWISLFRNPRAIFGFLKEHMQQLTSAFMVMVLWPIIPSLFCDMFFYATLYFSPLQASSSVYQKFIALHNL